jgi:hypothetical protein
LAVDSELHEKPILLDVAPDAKLAASFVGMFPNHKLGAT